MKKTPQPQGYHYLAPPPPHHIGGATEMIPPWARLPYVADAPFWQRKGPRIDPRGASHVMG